MEGTFRDAGTRYREGLGHATQENAGAFAFSIMVTSIFGVVAAFEHSPSAGQVFVFAASSVTGFLAFEGIGELVGDPSQGSGRISVRKIAAALSLFSVLCGIGVASLVAWPAGAWLSWALAPFCGVLTFLLVNALEHALAEEGDDGPD
jgi:hypothetical protein